MLGLKHDQNVLVDYDPAWPEEFKREAERLRPLLVNFEYAIEHCGSTSVPGFRAKPIIDILVGIQPFEEWDTLKKPLEELGYEYVEQAGIPGHHIFGKGRDHTERTHLLHLVELNSPNWWESIKFRDALRSNVALREQYLVVKEHASIEAPSSRAAYNRIKAKFFAGITI